ncbi:leucine-rich repeat domain-containing protein [Faecalibacterium prausnitzii]|uniref:Internalin n=1 Tax=Faecalibacterium prausnitzii TaxID=853 RepID=A0A291TC24_9FIRM|nr:leucine-rich repeat domain-containing protein [Faecalibacterium prausnitzii]ATL90665.1 internalin [Faecalibacterium prausnitzii]
MKQRFTKRTRLVSALLTLAMVFTFLPFSAFAANTEIAFDSPDFQLNFPDAEFQRFLKEKCDTNHNGKLDAQELSITEMTITDDYKIKKLEGIRFFEDLEKLDCHGIGLTTLNVGKNFKLKELDCSYNQLKEYFPILSSGLKILNCSHNNLTYMDLGILSGLKLEEVDCSYNKIWRIVMRSEEELVKFDCSNNELMALDVSRCYQLKQLNCSVNQLVELDVKNQTNLTLLDCHHNELTELNVSKNQNLASLTCDGNQLTTLDLSKNTSLSHLSCAENRLAYVDFSHMVGSTINADGNRHPIAVLTNGTFDLNTLLGFDVGKASNWYGGTVSGTTLSVKAGANEVSYQYDCGKGVKPTFIFETSLPINEKNFPDANFRNYIKTYKAGGRDVLTVEEQRKVESIDVKGWNISNLKGIEAFPNLKELNCGNNSIQKLDLRQNPELEKLICNKNQLTQLDLSKNPKIYHLICSENQLEQLDVSHLESLVTLDCSHNDLEQLDVKNSKFLVALNCSWNRLTELDADVSHKSQLERVECQNNQLTSLILGENKGLKKLNCAHNQLTQLNLDNMISLEELNCFDNQLTVLDVSNSPKLTKLWLGDNHLTSLNLDNNPNLNFTYTDIYSGENVYTVTLNPDRTFDLSTLPGGFDISRVTGWEHGKANGNILTVDEGTNVVYYAYKCRSDILEVSFKLVVTGTGGSTGGGSTGGGSTGGGSTGGGSTGGGTTTPEAGKYQLTVTDGVATVNGITSDVLNVKPGDTVTLTADTTKFPENEEFGWWEITPYGSVSNTLTGQYQRTATFTMPNENVSARAMSKSAGVSTGGDDGGGGGGAAILLVGGAAVAGLVGYGVYSYVSEQQLKALLPEGVAMPENRAQTALLLWNTAGRPEPAEAPAFKDVADPDTAKAAQWCVEHGLMDQKLGGRFAPDNSDPAYKTLNAYQQLVG